MLCPIYQNAEAENRQKPLFVTLQTTYLRYDKPKRRYGKTERRFVEFFRRFISPERRLVPVVARL